MLLVSVRLLERVGRETKGPFSGCNSSRAPNVRFASSGAAAHSAIALAQSHAIRTSRRKSAQIVARRFRALECGGGSDHIVFAQAASNNLQPDRHAVAGNAFANRCSGLPGQIERVSVIHPGHQAAVLQLIRNILAGVEGRDRQHRRQQKIVASKNARTLPRKPRSEKQTETKGLSQRQFWLHHRQNSTRLAMSSSPAIPTIECRPKYGLLGEEAPWFPFVFGDGSRRH